MTELSRLNHATAHLDPPLAAIDLAVLRANAAGLARRADGKPIRVASKAIRSRELLRTMLAVEGFRGVLAFTLPEAIWLAESGFDDVVTAYPTVDRAALRRLAADPVIAESVAVMVDSVEQLDLIEKAVAEVPDAAAVRVCVDIDASWRPLRGRLRFGALRSPLHSPESVVTVAREAVDREGFRLVGLHTGEARASTAAIRALGAAELAERRAAIVAAVKEIAQLEFVNAGAAGSAQRAAAEDAVTELTVGAGLFQSAALFALPVVRRPGPGVVTVLGGGYVSSGRSGRDRLPRPLLPDGLRYDRREGAGEAQTPLLGAAADELAIGDRVWFRPGKAGELAERFAEFHLIDGESVVAAAPTYRGDGQTFL